MSKTFRGAEEFMSLNSLSKRSDRGLEGGLEGSDGLETGAEEATVKDGWGGTTPAGGAESYAARTSTGEKPGKIAA